MRSFYVTPNQKASAEVDDSWWFQSRFGLPQFGRISIDLYRSLYTFLTRENCGPGRNTWWPVHQKHVLGYTHASGAYSFFRFDLFCTEICFAQANWHAVHDSYEWFKVRYDRSLLIIELWFMAYHGIPILSDTRSRDDPRTLHEPLDLKLFEASYSLWRCCITYCR